MPPASSGPRWLATLLAGAALASPAAAAGAPPPEGTCPALNARPGAGVAEDAAPTRMPEGALVGHDALLALRHLLPEEVWQLRHAFFFDGMRLEIGACHRRYPTADFYAAATEQFAGKARLDADGNLHGYVAGLPFPPATIDPAAPDAAARWAWNFEKRYRGAGPDRPLPPDRLPEPHGRHPGLRGLVLLAPVARARRSRGERLHDSRRRREPLDRRRPLRPSRWTPATSPGTRSARPRRRRSTRIPTRPSSTSPRCGRCAARRPPGSTASSRPAIA